MRESFQMHTINLSVAVRSALSPCSESQPMMGVLMGTYIHQTFLQQNPTTKEAIREAVVTAGLKRVRPAAMTTATTLIALLPVLDFYRKGSRYHGTDGNTHFRRYADTIHDYVRSPCIAMLVARKCDQKSKRNRTFK